MRADFNQIKSDFISINDIIKEIAVKIEENLYEIFDGFEHLDKIGCRVKGEKSFLDKTLKEDKGILKYKTPLKEIQDLIGARVVVYYKSDVEKAVEVIKKYFNFVEQINFVPDDVTKFGYEGRHFICFIPNPIYASHKNNLLIPDFFELQQLQVELNQLPDSMRKDFIIQNESWLSSIANDSTNFYQADGLTLLEEAYDTLLNRNFYLGSDMQARMMNHGYNKSDDTQDCGMNINPNPARNIVEVKINSDILAEGQQIIIYDLQGKKILINETLEKKEKYSINISNFIKGNYYVVLKSPETILCVRKLIIE